MSTFFKEIYHIVAQIPWGKVVSYGQIARALGAPRSARVVGWAMRGCPEGLPWHRVIKSDGSLSSGVIQDLCRDLLAGEGIKFLPDGRVDMQAYQWNIQESLWTEQKTIGEEQ